MSGVKVLCGGTFNKIHEGHIHFLKRAKGLGDFLVVVIANNAHNKKPYAVPQEQRKQGIEKLGIADKVLIGDPDKFVGVVEKEKPNIIALGYDQKLPEDVKAKLDKLSANIIRIEKLGEHSTKKMLGKV